MGSEMCIRDSVSPCFEARGPGEVVVRIAFDDGEFTPNMIYFNFFVNTVAANTIAMGTATLPLAQAGKRLDFFLQTKDSRGDNRKTGGDEVLVDVHGPEGVFLSSRNGRVAVEDMGNGTYRMSYHAPLVGSYSASVCVGDGPEAPHDEEPEPIRGSPFAMTVQESWLHVAVAGAPPAAKDRIRMWTSADCSIIYVTPEDAIIGDTDATFAVPELLLLDSASEDEEGQLDGSESAHSEMPADDASAALVEGAESMAEEVVVAGDAVAEGHAWEVDVDEAALRAAATATVDAREAELAEDEAAYYAAEEEGADAPGAAVARKRKRRPPRPKPTEVWQLDYSARRWSQAAAVATPLEAKEQSESQLKQAVQRLGLPERLIGRMVNDERFVRDWSVPGVRARASPSDVPSARCNFAATVVDRRLYVYGGEGPHSEAYDDLYRLDMNMKTWSRLYAGATLPKQFGQVGPSRHWRGVFVGSKLVRISVGDSGMLDLVQILDLREIEADEDGLFATVLANAKERVARLSRHVTEVSAGMETTLVEGDFAQLRMVMGCVSEVRNRSVETEYEIDVLVETLALLQREVGGEELGEMRVGLHQVAETWADAKRRLVTVRRMIKGPMERETNRIADEVRAANRLAPVLRLS